MTRRNAGVRALAGGLAAALIACGGPSVQRAAESTPGAETDAAPAAAAPARPEASEVPEDYVEMQAAGIFLFDGGHVLGLADAGEGAVVPISIGGTEALSISLRLEGASFARPLTHDLLDAALRELGAEVARVQIDRMEQGVFYASVHLRHRGGAAELDARSSDAVAIAIGHGVPIFVATQVIDAAGILREDLESGGDRADAPQAE